MARRIRGDRAFKRLLTKLPDAVREEIRATHMLVGAEQLAKGQSLVPVYAGKPRKGLVPGALKAGLSFKVTPAGLKLKFGLVGKPTNRKLYYGHIVEHGRKAGVVTVSRGSNGLKAALAAGGRTNNYKSIALRLNVKGTYQMRIGGMAPQRFVYTTPRDQLYAPYRAVWQRALAVAASGGTSDV